MAAGLDSDDLDDYYEHTHTHTQKLPVNTRLFTQADYRL